MQSILWRPVIFCLGLLGFTLLFQTYVVDDAYITYSYARTLGLSGTWGMHPHFPSNAATSPLNVLLLAAVVRCGLSALNAQVVLTTALLLTVFVQLRFLARSFFGRDTWAYLSTALLFTNPLLLSTTGLETYLFLDLVVCCLALLLEGHYALLGAACALLILARPDGLLLAALLVPVLLPRGLRPLLTATATFLLVVSAWGIYAWRVIGSLLPDTYFLKRQQPAWVGHRFGDGLLLYLDIYPAATLLSFALLFSLPLLLFVHRRAPARWNRFSFVLGAFALLHFLTYSIIAVPPYHWYYGPECGALVLLGSGTLLLLLSGAEDATPACAWSVRPSARGWCRHLPVVCGAASPHADQHQLVHHGPVQGHRVLGKYPHQRQQLFP